MAASLKTNVVLNAIRTFCSIAFPAITFAYVSRILDVQGYGMFDYTRSIVSYFSLIAQLGVFTYGMREIPKVKHDKEKLTKLVSELFCYNLIATVVAYILFFSTIYSVEKFESYRPLLLINGLLIGFCALGLEWMYGALEEYKYITIRTIVFQIISFALLLLFVKEKTDIYVYAAINVFSSVGSNILNFYHARKYLGKPVVKISNIFKHTKSIFIFWGNNITGTVYLLIATTMLGYMCGDYSVGLYSSANKICRIFITLTTSICPIMLSRSSSYLAHGRQEEYDNLTKRSFDAVMIISIPIAVMLFCFSKDVILLFSGASFLPAVPLSQVLSVLMLIMPMSSFLSMQILIPYGKEGVIFKVLLFATLFNAGFSLFFFPKYQHTAAAVINLSTEFLIFAFFVYLSRKHISLASIASNTWHYLLAGVFQFMSIMLIYDYSNANIEVINLFCAITVGLIVYLVVLLLVKDDFTKMAIRTVTSRYYVS